MSTTPLLDKLKELELAKNLSTNTQNQAEQDQIAEAISNLLPNLN